MDKTNSFPQWAKALVSTVVSLLATFWLAYLLIPLAKSLTLIGTMALLIAIFAVVYFAFKWLLTKKSNMPPVQFTGFALLIPLLVAALVFLFAQFIASPDFFVLLMSRSILKIIALSMIIQFSGTLIIEAIVYIVSGLKSSRKEN